MIVTKLNYFLCFILLATLLNSQTLRQFLEKRDLESKMKRDPRGRREVERVYCPKKSVVSNVKLPIIKSITSILKRRK